MNLESLLYDFSNVNNFIDDTYLQTLFRSGLGSGDLAIESGIHLFCNVLRYELFMGSQN